jgi:serine/threonine protein phosphatase PrpC
MLINYIFSAKTDVGLVRKVNEDNLGQVKTPNGHLFVVCDGMGGHKGGAKASTMAVDCIKEYISNNKANSYQTLIEEAIAFANFQIHATAATSPELNKMGTTCVVLLVANDRKIYYGHVGDSRIYRYNNGILSRITKDHSFVQYLVDTGEITEEEMETHPNRNQILKALGIDESVKPSICESPIVAQSDDLFLLCSDGLTGMVTDEVIKSKLTEITQHGLDGVNKQLIDLANNNGGKDNITSLIVKFESLDTTTVVLGDQRITMEPDKKGYKNVLFLVGILVFLAFAYYLSSTLWSTGEGEIENKKVKVEPSKKAKVDIISDKKDSTKVEPKKTKNKETSSSKLKKEVVESKDEKSTASKGEKNNGETTVNDSKGNN